MMNSLDLSSSTEKCRNKLSMNIKYNRNRITPIRGKLLAMQERKSVITIMGRSELQLTHIHDII